MADEADESGEEVLDDNNDESTFTLSSANDAATEEEDTGAHLGDCDDGDSGALRLLETGAGTRLPPCPHAGSYGLDVGQKALYAGGPPEVAPRQPVFHKVHEVSTGALTEPIVTDLDDPPPKTPMSNLPGGKVPLESIVEGAPSGPMTQVVSTSAAETPALSTWGQTV